MANIRAAVIGVGNMGTAHAACLAAGKVEGMALTAVCDIATERLDACAERFPEAARYADWQELLREHQPEAVIVAVPHPLHGEIASACLAAGCHTLVEKPIDIALSRAQRLCDAAQESGRVFGIMFNQRTNPLFRRCREIVQGGQLGEMKRTVWIITNWYRTQHYYDSGSWRATWGGEGGGVLLNQAPHNLDLWQWICGMPESVTAYCDTAKYHRIEVEDEATLLTHYKNGATGAFITSTGEYPGTNRLEISGTKGKLVLENGVMKWWRLAQDEAEVRFQSQENFAKIPVDYEEILPDGPEAAHAGILNDFSLAIRTGTPLLAPGVEGVHELTLSNAAYLSQWLGNVSVSLPLDTALFDRLLQERAAQSVYKPREAQGRPEGEYSDRWQVRW